MTMLVTGYASKKELKGSLGKALQYRETSAFGNEYKADGTFSVANRPSLTNIGREFFATVTMSGGLISRVD